MVSYIERGKTTYPYGKYTYECFLVAKKHLYNWLCPSVGGSVCLSVTHSFDNPHVAPYWPTWPCSLKSKLSLNLSLDYQSLLSTSFQSSSQRRRFFRRGHACRRISSSISSSWWRFFQWRHRRRRLRFFLSDGGRAG